MKKDYLSKLVAKMKTNKRFEITVYVVLIGLAILVYFLAASPGGKEKNTSDATSDATEQVSVGPQELETRLSKVLSNMQGAGKVEVMITYESGSEIVPAMNVDRQTSTETSDDGSKSTQNESSTPATISGGSNNELIVLTELEPKIRGVIVVAEGADDYKVKMNLQYAVQTVLGVKANCIEIFSMEQDKED